jgi:site-specific DNA-methyltransferase (adenine-specific)
MSDLEYIDWTVSLFNEFNRVLKQNSIVIYNMSYGNENPNLMNLTIAKIIENSNFSLSDIIIWKKSTAMPNSPSKNRLTKICEFIYIFCRKDELYTFDANKRVINDKENVKFYESIDNIIFARNNDESNDLNKATFSTELVRKLFNIYAQPNSIVYDPFMGTGTTAKACIIEKHDFIGSEISPSQVEYANNRLKPYYIQQTLF